MKRIVVLCDGTWSRADQKNATNIATLKKSIPDVAADGIEQKVGYDEGVGVVGAMVTRLAGGAFGWGLSQNVRDGYAHVVKHYEHGDDVFLFGYSRGAYTARSLAGFIRNVGVITTEGRDEDQVKALIDEAYALYRDPAPEAHPNGEKAVAFRKEHSHPDFGIRFIGVFDTVGSLGIPGFDNPLIRRLNKKWGFHDTDLSSTVKAAFHALAIDEQRKTFAPTLWKIPQDAPDQVAEQVWFAGGHSNVGGGHPDRGLSDIALRWIGAKAAGQGLDTGLGALPGKAVDGGLGVGRVGVFKVWRPLHRLIALTRGPDQAVASTAKERFDQNPDYRPPRLKPALDGGIDVVPV
ncbi:DUF2235 domain-containing protein [Demequina mangrovi]|uniref:Uncharacterized protein, PA2063/DUF2235 family n=1 Tax=Demequina mangrovi TaxID=1043493 RepID=A0A1H6UFW1_9MICO|nr:DUF2235 domain-containing protein [Demequina mangrovi]SEI91288.1 Uncharacterized protein, PA2063/DUF2235 family [Demequina mangrovi]